MKNNYFFLLFLFTMSMTHAMQSEDFYGNKELVPIIHTYKKIPDTTKQSKDLIPVIENFKVTRGSNQQENFSIELLRYNSSLLSPAPLLDETLGDLAKNQSIVNSILNNEDKIVITQNNINQKIVYIPINVNNDNLSSKTQLLLLALIAGKEHFKTNNATITIKDDDMQTWTKLFQRYQTLRNLKKNLTQIPFNLHFNLIKTDKESIKNILILVHSIRENFDIASTTDTILKDKEEKRTDSLNYFLTTGVFLQQQQEKKVPKFWISFYYAAIKRQLHHKLLKPLKKWFDYFYDSYRFWFG